MLRQCTTLCFVHNSINMRAERVHLTIRLCTTLCYCMSALLHDTYSSLHALQLTLLNSQHQLLLCYNTSVRCTIFFYISALMCLFLLSYALILITIYTLVYLMSALILDTYNHYIDHTYYCIYSHTQYCINRYDESEALYRELDRKDLAIDLRQRLGDWFRVVHIIKQASHICLL
jgi:predicted membrane protein